MLPVLTFEFKLPLNFRPAISISYTFVSIDFHLGFAPPFIDISLYFLIIVKNIENFKAIVSLGITKFDLR